MNENQPLSAGPRQSPQGRGPLISYIGDALIVLSSVFCSLGCVMSAYGISRSVILYLLAALTAAALIVCALAARLRYKGLVISLFVTAATIRSLLTQ